MLERMLRKGNPCEVLVGMEIGAVTMEKSIAFPQKINSGTTIWPSNPTSEEMENTNLKRYMHPYAHSSTIYNSQDRETTHCPMTDDWIKKLWYRYTMEYYSAK